MTKFNCYIDESGDEGYAPGSSEWFILGALIVKTANDLAVSHAIDRIKTRLNVSPRRPLHWRDLSHAKKKVVIQELASEPILISTVAMCKKRLDRPSTIRNWQSLYFYTTRFLLERVSWYIDDAGGTVNITFSNRGRLDYGALKTYLKRVQETPSSQLRPVINQIHVKQSQQLKLLQAADAIAGSLFNALEPDFYGNCEPSYFLQFKHCLYRRKGRLSSYGLKLFPDGRNDRQYFRETYPWLSTIGYFR